ncbi:unnamed protein product, partial [marine sediment metagenome]
NPNGINKYKLDNLDKNAKLVKIIERKNSLLVSFLIYLEK